MSNRESSRLEPKDLITVGVFTALYFVMFFVSGMLGYIPVFMLLIPFICPLLAGIPFMLYLTKVKKFGMITITGLICGILMLVTGMSWQGVISGALFGLIADLMLRSRGYKSASLAVPAYGVFSIWLMGMMFPLFFMRDAYFTNLRPVYGDEYTDALLALTPRWAFYALIAVTFAGGIAGGFLGKSVLKKHFARAGLA